jgi:hypothetical protein
MMIEALSARQSHFLIAAIDNLYAASSRALNIRNQGIACSIHGQGRRLTRRYIDPDANYPLGVKSVPKAIGLSQGFCLCGS